MRNRFFSRPALALVLLIAAFASTGCAAQEPQVELKGEIFTVELARTREEQARGLMFVEEMPADRGMLFIFPREGMRAFWMKNTRIPLDILYFDRDLALVSVVENARPCAPSGRCPSHPSAGPAQYVLELNAGMARSLGVQRGDVMTLLFEP
ncbi:MAG: DUF192 domain-containing protein [Xanthomonadales bacterium]|nr:DUF192 domain-containing protein [Xanthomonadales bacterium]